MHTITELENYYQMKKAKISRVIAAAAETTHGKKIGIAEYSLNEQKRAHLERIFRQSGAGLLIIDLQNDFISPQGKSALWNHNIAPMTTAAQRIKEVADIFRALHLPIIFSKTYDDPEYRGQGGKNRFILSESRNKERGVVCIDGTWGSELFLPAKDGDIIIEKHKLSVRNGTNLSNIIAAQGITTLYVTGVKTQRCVMTTVRDLCEYEASLHVVTLEDCIATDDLRQQESTLAELRAFHPPVISSAELFKRWHITDERQLHL
jgi:nicotinamidase-related amidase